MTDSAFLKHAVVPQDTMALISEQQWGRPKSEEHRQKIAAAQARRHAAQRVLKAVEDVHRTASGQLLHHDTQSHFQSTSKACSNVLHEFTGGFRLSVG